MPDDKKVRNGKMGRRAGRPRAYFIPQRPQPNPTHFTGGRRGRGEMGLGFWVADFKSSTRMTMSEDRAFRTEFSAKRPKAAKMLTADDADLRRYLIQTRIP